jgi:hypothetical protein
VARFSGSFAQRWTDIRTGYHMYRTTDSRKSVPCVTARALLYHIGILMDVFGVLQDFNLVMRRVGSLVARRQKIVKPGLTATPGV